VGHARLLPALGLDRSQTLAELVAALLLCARPASRTNVETLGSLRFRWACTWRAWWIGFWLRVISGRTACGPMILFLRARQQWDQYLEHYHQTPGLVATQSDGGGTVTLATPRLAHVEHILTSSGLSPTQVLDLPLNEAYWRASVAREATGQWQILEHPELEGEAYAEAQAHADAFEAAYRKAQA
jgi:hypothetical protein